MAKKIVADAGKKLATAAELETLRTLQAEFARAQVSMAAHDIFAAFTAWESHNTRLAAVARRGAVHTEPARTREDYERDFLGKNEAAKQAMRQVCQEAVPVARSLVEKFASLANAAAVEAEKQEAARFAEWSLPYAASALVTSLRGVADSARRRVPSNEYAAVAPQAMLPYLTFG
jgi:hypothetical protein